MKKIKKLLEKYREFIVYVIVGFSTTIINWVVSLAYAYTFGNAGWHLTINTTVAWIVATVYAFFMNKLVVFRSKDLKAKTLLVEGGEFCGARLFSWGLETAGMNLLCKVLGFEALTFSFVVTNSAATVFQIPLTGFIFSKLCMLVITTVSNYIFSKFVIFRKKVKKEQPEEVTEE
ncbi:MAG: GtrA family protein [Clostridia bacterium]|nr:GtrA family protein [Clostridia bacterium]